MYILGTKRDRDPVGAFARYRGYLEENRERFPPSAYALACSAWYFDPSDSRCPHDSWVERFELIEDGGGERREQRVPSIRITLLGAYHDRLIVLRYPGVRRYSLEAVELECGHSGWRYDEFRATDQGLVLHQIEWCRLNDTARWSIEAEDVLIEWQALPPRLSTRALV